jgi:hypothetical protein
MAKNKRQKPRLDDDTVFWGILWGMVMGALWAVINLPSVIVERRTAWLGRAKDIHHQVDLSEPIAESLASGKELAKQNRQKAQEQLQ